MKKAFTLTELLLTITIIGVIAALVLPSMVKQYRLRVLSTQLRRTYEQIETAVKTVMEEEFTSDFYHTRAGSVGNISTTATATNMDGPLYFLTNYFKVRNTCQYLWTNANGTNATALKYQNTTNNSSGSSQCKIFATSDHPIGYWLYGYGGHCVGLDSGAIICMRHVGTNENTTRQLLIDTNGKSSPNLIGYDIFSLKIDSKGHVSDYVDESTCPEDGLCCRHGGGILGPLDTPLVGYVDRPNGCFHDVVNNNWKIIEY